MPRPQKNKPIVTDEMRAQWAQKMGTLMGTLDDAVADDIERKKRRVGDNRVCKCGHPAKTHTGYHNPSNRDHRYKAEVNDFMCKPGKQICPCQKAELVITATNSGLFLRRTEGSGRKHALGQGIENLLLSGGDFEWLEDVVCDLCLTNTDKFGNPRTYIPIPLKNNIPVTYPTNTTKLVCEECVTTKLIPQGLVL
jgi:hypothetical protein